MMHGFWIIALVIAGLMGLAAWQPDVGAPFVRSLAIRFTRRQDPAEIRRQPLPMRTMFVSFAGLFLGASVITFVDPSATARTVGLVAYASGLIALVTWTGVALVPKRRGASPWP